MRYDPFKLLPVLAAVLAFGASAAEESQTDFRPADA